MGVGAGSRGATLTRHGGVRGYGSRVLVVLVLFVALPIVIALAAKGNHYPPGCLRQADINIGYYPYTLAREAVLRVQPRDDAPVIRALEAGRRFGVQSLVNPDRLADPGMPDAVDGYVWGYSRKGGRSGWIREDALTLDEGAHWADGPSHQDFEAGGVAVPRLRALPRFTLGYPMSGSARVVENTAYLRWAPNGAARRIVLGGEPMRLLWRASGHVCVEVDGARGWVNVDFTSEG